MHASAPPAGRLSQGTRCKRVPARDCVSRRARIRLEKPHRCGGRGEILSVRTPRPSSRQPGRSAAQQLLTPFSRSGPCTVAARSAGTQPSARSGRSHRRARWRAKQRPALSVVEEDQTTAAPRSCPARQARPAGAVPVTSGRGGAASRRTRPKSAALRSGGSPPCSTIGSVGAQGPAPGTVDTGEPP